MNDYVQRSFLFELVNKSTRSKPVESFTLILPPEEEEITEPQRVSYTKTFGGLFVDDYGDDEKKIVISGNTGNSKLKKTFSSPNSKGRVPEKMNGQDSFFYFRNKIMRYKDQIKNWDKYEMILYDLSLIPEYYRNKDFRRQIPYITEGYVVKLDRFKMKRSKEKPLFFNYTIELTTLRKLGSVAVSYKAPVIIPSPFNLLTTIKKGLNSVKAVYGKIVAIKNEIESYIEFIGQLEDQMIAFYDQTVDVLIYPAELCKQALGQAKSLGSTIQSIGELSAADIGIIEKTYLDSITIMQEILQSTAALVTKSKEPNSFENSFTIRSSIGQTTVNSSIKRYEELTELESELFNIVQDVDTSDNEIKVIYGHEIVVATEEITLESLALEYYGNASLQELIAFYNNFESVEDITLGDIIKIPILSQFTINNPGNMIYTTYLDDIYGIDIKLSKKNDPVVSESGDYSTISKNENVAQAMDLRLNESLGARLRLTVYGIKASIGSPLSSSISYILSNINDTVMQDPRVEEIENIIIVGSGDKLLTSFDIYTIKRGEVIPFNNTI
jgi:hypothetical protein